MLGLIGLLTLVIMSLPFLLDEKSKMISILFDLKSRGYVHPAPTFWTLLNYFISIDDSPEKRLSPFLAIIIQIAVAFIFFFFLMKKRSSHIFLMTFTQFGITYFMFGYAIHEKHIHYMYMSFLLQPLVYKEYSTILMIITSSSLFLMGFHDNTEISVFAHAVFIVAISYLFEENMKTYAENNRNRNKNIRQGNWIYNLSRYCSEAFISLSGSMKILLTAIEFGMYLIYKNAIDNFGYPRNYETNFDNSIILFDSFPMIPFFIWSWLLLLQEVFSPEDNQNHGNLLQIK